MGGLPFYQRFLWGREVSLKEMGYGDFSKALKIIFCFVESSLNFLMLQCLNVMYSHGGSGKFVLCSRLRFRPGWPRGLEGEVRERHSSSFFSWGGKGLGEFRL